MKNAKKIFVVVLSIILISTIFILIRKPNKNIKRGTVGVSPGPTGIGLPIKGVPAYHTASPAPSHTTRGMSGTLGSTSYVKKSE